MKRVIAPMFAALMMVVLVSSSAFAVQDAVTPSTNDANRTAGWAYVDVTVTSNSAALTFISTRNFFSCFEVRTDGDLSQVLTENDGANYNTDVTDGLYPYYCENGSTETVKVHAAAFVEVRMVFGAENDERFDWTRFDLLPNRPSTAPGQDKLLCFDGTTDGFGYGGTCTLPTKGAKGSAILDTDGGNVNGEYAGVYVLNSNVYGQPLGAVASLSFNYTGTAPGAGAPRFSLPVAETGTSTTAYAFISAYYCNDSLGLVDAINDPTCTIWYGANSYANWSAFAAAYPTAVVATDAYVFVIADEPGLWTVSNVKFGKPGK